MADKLQDEFECEVTTIQGNRGEFSVWIYVSSLEPVRIIEKEGYNFPDPESVVKALDAYLDSIA